MSSLTAIIFAIYIRVPSPAREGIYVNLATAKNRNRLEYSTAHNQVRSRQAI
jgi:hypothetical protein